MVQPESMKQTADRFHKACIDAAEAWKKYFEVLGRSVMKGYKAAGEPYGQSDEGMYRWFNEQCKD